MGAKRNKLQVTFDILKAIQEKNGKIKRTHILYKANLSHQMLDEYLKDLIERDFVIEENAKVRNYSLTDKGFDYINKYQRIVSFTEFFGID